MSSSRRSCAGTGADAVAGAGAGVGVGAGVGNSGRLRGAAVRSPRGVVDVLGFLLKHAHLELEARTTVALEPLGVDPKTLGVMRAIANAEAASQQQVAAMLGIDRTSMVAVLDGLESRGIVARRPDPADRRRNVIALTPNGQALFDEAEVVSEQAERAFLAPIGDRAGALHEALRALVVQEDRE